MNTHLIKHCPQILHIAWLWVSRKHSIPGENISARHFIEQVSSIGQVPRFSVEVKKAVLKEGVGGLVEMKIHVGLESLGLNNVVWSNTLEQKTSVGFGVRSAATVQRVDGLAKPRRRLHFGFEFWITVFCCFGLVTWR